MFIILNMPYLHLRSFSFLPKEVIRENNIVFFDEHQRRKFIEETALFVSTTAKEIQDLNYQMETKILELHHNQPKMFYQQVVSQLLTVSFVCFLIFVLIISILPLEIKQIYSVLGSYAKRFQAVQSLRYSTVFISL